MIRVGSANFLTLKKQDAMDSDHTTNLLRPEKHDRLGGRKPTLSGTGPVIKQRFQAQLTYRKAQKASHSAKQNGKPVQLELTFH